MDKVIIKRVLEKDVLKLQQIGRITFADTFSDYNTADNMNQYLDEVFSEKRLIHELREPQSQFYFAMEEQKVIGYLKINTGLAQTESQTGNSLEIERIYVLKSYHGKGIGELLLNYARTLACNTQVEFIWLGVWEHNQRALHFYRKHGFVAYASHEFRLGGEVQKDLLMKMNMEYSEKQAHWENIYRTKSLNEVSWYQPIPTPSLDFIRKHGISKDARIIDIGGGDSFLADHLIEMGFRDITVLDISETAIQRAQERLGPKAGQIHWIVSDIKDFKPMETYDLWHDRATFHFLTEENEISYYSGLLRKALNPTGIAIIGTFSENGPQKCSGIPIRQYSESTMAALFSPFLEKTDGITLDHLTPFDTIQNFVFCCFQRSLND